MRPRPGRGAPHALARTLDRAKNRGIERDPDLLDLSVRELLARLSATEPPLPGGGSAAAIVAAMAAAVTAMAARVSAREWPPGRAFAAQAEALRARAEPLAGADAVAYADVLALLRGARTGSGLDEELGAALSAAAEVPLRIGEVGADVAEVAVEVALGGSPALQADAVAAAILADAVTRVAAGLVEVNLATTEDDSRVAAARELVARAGAALSRTSGRP